MGFLLALFGVLCAEEVVELEEVRASVGTNLFKCNDFSSVERCRDSPYCYWLASNDAGQRCIDDPCIASGAQEAGITQCGDALTGAVSCSPKVVTADVLNGDCNGGTGTFCVGGGYTGTYDYCFWARLRDNGTCPDSVCKTENSKCVPNNEVKCQSLSTKEECGLTPKCVWITSNSLGCIQDPCFVGSESKSCGGDFIDGTNWINETVTARESRQVKPGGGDLVKSDCISYKPFRSGGGYTNYCVYKENSAPNLCYFLLSNISTMSTAYNTDYGNTYPTYSVSPAKAPKCDKSSTVIAACDSHESTSCTTKWNRKGAFAGAYCGDAAHGTNEGGTNETGTNESGTNEGGAMFLRGPSLLLLLASALLLLAW